jgi:hypothetical protein
MSDTTPGAADRSRSKEQRHTLNVTTVVLLGLIILRGAQLLQLKRTMDSPLLPSYILEDLSRPLILDLILLSTALLAGILLRLTGRHRAALVIHIGGLIVHGLLTL